MTSKRPRVFYGWLIVGVSAVGLFLGAPLLVFSFSVFFKPLVLNFHASRAAVSFAFSLQNSVGALDCPQWHAHRPPGGQARHYLDDPVLRPLNSQCLRRFPRKPCSFQISPNKVDEILRQFVGR